MAEAKMKKRIVYDSEIAGFAAMGSRQVTNHFSLVSVVQNTRRQIRRKEAPGHSKHLGNELADGLAPRSPRNQLGRDALRRAHLKVIESELSEPRPEHILMQHVGWTGWGR